MRMRWSFVVRNICSMALCLVFICSIVAFVQMFTRGGDAEPSFNATEARLIIRDLCNHYNSGFASGDLCLMLCFQPDHEIQEFHSRNKAVIGTNLVGQRLLLKSQNRFFFSYDMLPLTLTDEQYLDAVVNMVNFHMAFGWPRNKVHHLLNEIWPSYARNRKLSNADRRSIWTLVNQEEFLNFKLLSYLKVFPKVVGTCGHVYAVEYIDPLEDSVYFHGPKYRVLHKAMGTLKILQDSLNEAVHMCDVKRDNFGESAAYPNRLMVLDGDMVFTESRMNALFESLRCKADSSCEFFSCVARCNLTSGYCTQRLNSNLEVFCEKFIFQLFGSAFSSYNKWVKLCYDKKMTVAQKMVEIRRLWMYTFPNL